MMESESDRKDFTLFLKPFAGFPRLHKRVSFVLERLPPEVQQDFLQDRRFRVALDNYEAGKGWTVWMEAPGAEQGSRCVVLRPRLDTAAEPFAHYIIAHEFAHAFLHNGGWGDITDVEEAADALAASWGFPKVVR